MSYSCLCERPQESQRSHALRSQARGLHEVVVGFREGACGVKVDGGPGVAVGVSSRSPGEGYSGDVRHGVELVEGEECRADHKVQVAGGVGAVLAVFGCQVVGVEIDPQAAQDARKFCERVIVGNLESETTLTQIPGGFDTIIFGDVLEHLVRPWQVLRALRDRLKPGGFIVVSIPNVAHWDARMGLLRGRFDYQQSGLLDATHLRFFTRRTTYELLRESGYRIVIEDDSLRLPMWVYSIRLVRRFAPKLLPFLSRLGPNLFTYQFVLKAVPAERSSGAKRGNPSTLDVKEARHT